MMRPSLLVGAASLLAGWLAVTPVWGQLGGSFQDGNGQDTVLIEAVIRIDIVQGPSRVVGALAYNSTLLLPLTQFLEMAELRVSALAVGDSLQTMLEPERVRVQFGPDPRRLTIGDTAVALGRWDAVWRDGELYVATAIVNRAFRVAIRVEWADLAAVIGQSASLPVIQRARRERRRSLMRPEEAARQALEIRPQTSVIDGAVVSWSATASTGGASQYGSLDLGIGAELFGGSFELRPQIWTSRGVQEAEFRGSWMRAWPESRWLRQVRLGDIQSSGRHSRLLRGFAVTNAPFIRSSEFDMQQLVGSVPAGWEVELYDRGRLTSYGVADALGVFRVPLQLRYGQNPYELVMYGPSGEVMRDRRTIRVPFSRLRRGQLEYAAAGGACDLDPCDGLMGVDVRYGLSNRVTLQGGWDTFFDGDLGTLWQPYSLASAAVLPELSVTGEIVINGHVRGTAAYEPTPDLRVSASHAEITASGARYLNLLTERQRSDASVFWRPGAMRGNLFLQFAGFRSAGSGTTRDLERVSATTRLRGVRYSLGLLHEGLRQNGRSIIDRVVFDVGADVILRGPIDWLRTASLQAAVAIDPNQGLTALRSSLGRRLGRTLRADLGMGWLRLGGLSIELSLTTTMPGPRFGTRSRVSELNGAESLVFVNGSAMWDGRSRTVRWGDGGDLGRAGVTGLVYRDDNANGVRDEDEPGLANIPVFVGGWYSTTDADGRFVAWDLFPFEPLAIEVDSLSFGDPRYVTPTQLIHVWPTPNNFLEIAIPVVVGAEVSGYVVFRGAGLPGVQVSLRNLVTGDEINLMSFADGAFYSPAVPPGEYELHVPERVLQQLNAFVPPIHIFVPPGAGEKRLENLVLLLEPLEP